MTPPRLPLSSTRSRLATVLGICIVTGAFVSCAAATTSPSARSARPAEQRVAATAEQVYRSYIDAWNAIDYADPATFVPAAEFTSAELYASFSESWESRHEQKQVVSGDMVVEYFQVVTASSEPIVKALACLDTSDITVVNSHGESELPEDAPDYFASYLRFTSAEAGLLLDSQQLEPISECDSMRREFSMIAPSPGVSSAPPADAPTPEPVLPVPGIPGAPAPEGPPPVPDPGCVVYSGDLMICGG